MTRLVRRRAVRLCEVLGVPNEDLKDDTLQLGPLCQVLSFVVLTSASVAPEANRLGCSVFQSRPRTVPLCRSVLKIEALNA